MPVHERGWNPGRRFAPGRGAPLHPGTRNVEQRRFASVLPLFRARCVLARLLQHRAADHSGCAVVPGSSCGSRSQDDLGAVRRVVHGASRSDRRRRCPTRRAPEPARPSRSAADSARISSGSKAFGSSAAPTSSSASRTMAATSSLQGLRQRQSRHDRAGDGHAASGSAAMSSARRRARGGPGARAGRARRRRGRPGLLRRRCSPASSWSRSTSRQRSAPSGSTSLGSSWRAARAWASSGIVRSRIPVRSRSRHERALPWRSTARNSAVASSSHVRAVDLGEREPVEEFLARCGDGGEARRQEGHGEGVAGWGCAEQLDAVVADNDPAVSRTG